MLRVVRVLVVELMRVGLGGEKVGMGGEEVGMGGEEGGRRGCRWRVDGMG